MAIATIERFSCLVFAHPSDTYISFLPVASATCACAGVVDAAAPAAEVEEGVTARTNLVTMSRRRCMRWEKYFRRSGRRATLRKTMYAMRNRER